MVYWLFTEGRAALSGCLAPLLRLIPLAPVMAAALMGASIRRTDQEKQNTVRDHVLRLLAHGIVSLGILALYLTLMGDFAIRRAALFQADTNGFIAVVAGGPPTVNRMRLFMAGLLGCMAVCVTNVAVHEGLRQGGWLRERVDRLRRPAVRRGSLGSSHFCTMREYRRYRRQDREGVSFLGAFWGENKWRLDYGTGTFHLSGEDAARGILTLGGAGSGKTQGVILPVIGDRMLAGHSLVVADPQGEIRDHVIRFAQVTGHLVAVHDPTSSAGPRYNLAADITSVSDARAIADVLVPSAHGDNRFWTDSAAALLAACLIRFDTLGDIYNALNDIKTLAETLAQGKDDAALLANAFIASVRSDGKVAANVVATLATALTGWASADVRANTGASDFGAELIVSQPTVVVLTCPGRMRAVYASYLGATLRKLMLDLDTIGELNGGPLPVPVGVVLDEFPTLGKLDSLVADVNLVRKRRISILIGAQTKGQFHLIYGPEGTQALLTGLATQIVFGGCDAETAEYYSKASGIATADANKDDPNSHLRQRPLLTVDEVITPQSGNCTIFARYVEPNFATQVILTARLTRLYERRDWRERFAAAKNVEPLLLERGISLDLKPITVPDIVPAATPGPGRAMMERVAERVAGMESVPSPLIPLAKMREAHRARVAAARER
jgi:type IV secretory pathway TraG/TraD family ATPase VirD4